MTANSFVSSRPARVVLVVLLLALAFVLRVWGGGPAIRDGHVVLRDSDTLRRLARMEAQDANPGTYPRVEWRDGAPAGSVIHWTTPMDACIRATNALARSFVPEARGYEAGALVVGPAIGTLAVLATFLLLNVWLGFGGAYAGASVLAVTMSSVASGTYGLADHQVLWLFAFAVAVPAFLLVVQKPEARSAPPILGTALGLALWTSSEVTLVFLGFAGLAFVSCLLARREQRVSLAWRHLTWSSCCAIVVALATALENERVITFRWDTVSLFHLWPVGVLVAFSAVMTQLARTRWNDARGVVLTALVALGLGLVPFAAQSVRDSFVEQLDQITAVNLWVRTAVFEFRPLFVVDGELTFDAAWTLLGPSLVLLPLVVLVVPFVRSLTPATRAGLVGFPILFLALGAYEVKLVPLVAIGLAPGLVVASTFLIELLVRRLAVLENRAWIVGTSILLLYAAREVNAASAFVNDQKVNETPFDRLVTWFEERDDAEPPPIVLAPWGLSAELLYHTRCGVVATGYHRNLSGIHDGYAFLVEEDLGAALALLERRRVDYVVTVARPLELLDAYTVLEHATPRLVKLGMRTQRGSDGHLVRVPHLKTDPAVRQTMFWRLAMNAGDLEPALAEHLRLVRASQAPSEVMPNVPLIRVYRVLRGTESVR